MNNLEKRNLPVEIKQDGQKIVGYAAVYNSLSENFGGWRERILPGAFNRSIADGHLIRALVNHDGAQVLGHTHNNRLKLNPDENGLAIEIDPVETSYGKDAIINLQEDNINKMSFAMICRKENWVEEDGLEIREIVDVDLFEVSILTVDPAFPDTSVGLRMLEEYKASKRYEAELKAKAAEAAKGFTHYEILQRQIELETFQ